MSVSPLDSKDKVVPNESLLSKSPVQAYAALAAGQALQAGSGDSFARYAASRSVALLLTVVIAICIRSRMTVAVLGIAMTVVQAFDGVIGALAPDPSKTYGPVAFAVLNPLAVIWLLGGKATTA